MLHIADSRSEPHPSAFKPAPGRAHFRSVKIDITDADGCLLILQIGTEAGARYTGLYFNAHIGISLVHIKCDKLSGTPGTDKPMKMVHFQTIACRQVRLERRTPSQINSEESLTWAVSYSDILMVLMSFFVLFFSIDDSKQTSLLSRIAKEINQNTSGSAQMQDTHADPEVESGLGGSGPMTSQAGHYPVVPAGKHPNTWLAELAEKLSASTNSSKVLTLDNFLVVDLKPDIYAPGSFALSDSIVPELSQILNVLKPYQDLIRVTFVGHADPAQLHQRQATLSNNFDLSALRASRARDYAEKIGFNPKYLSIEGRGQKDRETRSLSVRVSALATDR